MKEEKKQKTQQLYFKSIFVCRSALRTNLNSVFAKELNGACRSLNKDKMIDTESSSPLNFNSTYIHFPHWDLELSRFLSTHWFWKYYCQICFLRECICRQISPLLMTEQAYVTTQIAPHLHRHVKSLHKTGTCAAMLHACEWDATYWASRGRDTHPSIIFYYRGST